MSKLVGLLRSVIFLILDFPQFARFWLEILRKKYYERVKGTKLPQVKFLKGRDLKRYVSGNFENSLRNEKGGIKSEKFREISESTIRQFARASLQKIWILSAIDDDDGDDDKTLTHEW